MSGNHEKSRAIRFALVIATAAALLGGRPALAQGKVDRAIDRGIEFLLQEEKAKQLGGEGRNAIGQLALETYALVVAGVSVNDPQIRENFQKLNKSAVGSNHTYTIACYLFAVDAAISQIESDLLILQPRRVRQRFRDDPRIGRELRPYLQKGVQALVRLQNDLGAWRYGPAKDFDNSNVQFAVLGLGVGVKRRVPIGSKVWRGVVDHFLKHQQQSTKEVKGRVTLANPKEKAERESGVELIPAGGRHGRDRSGRSGRSGRHRGERKGGEGHGRTVVVGPEEPEVGTEDIKVFERGWAYAADKNYRWNMTCAGLSSCLLARENLRGKIPSDLQGSLNQAVRDGYGWLMAHWEPTKSYYGIYSLEKVADIGGVKLFDGKDWYEEISSFLVGAQKGDGSWPGGKGPGGTARVATSFALLVLNRATSLLTMSPGSRIMISGKGRGLDAPNDRSWVYVPELDVTMHYPSLLRVIRLRPTPKLIHFLRNIVENYPEEYKGELIPDMAKARDGIPSKSARKVLNGYLADITGFAYDDPEKYLAWHRRWQRVMLIGSERKRKRIPDLIAYYKSTKKSFALKKTIMWALIQCKAKQAIPLFLADLEHEDGRFRLAAYNAFRAFFIDYPPTFSATAPERVRKEQVAHIKEWYQRQLRG